MLREWGPQSVEFDSNSLWAAEGLFIGFLPGDAQTRLIQDITDTSAPGSRLAVDHLPGAGRMPSAR
jgi:O-methyltransferase involved in polyketide biosynthesis